ncbi:hypothetical protein [Marivita sp. GX14005]|uniref:hypothetical protein n=1 Tax=Marivita sp. GX14005 TaxID=2942276 RepID=UPI0020190DA5|nr:hypothetical protein [Marivita sp. GX14005]MCL3882234.1 hypothetical protein [Marivita sp. GX14005]
MLRLPAVLLLTLGLTACGSSTRDLEEPTEPLGDFGLGHIGVVAPNLQKLLISREATADEWTETVEAAFATRFKRFEGEKYYHFGISAEAYSLPPPIVPGKSALALNVTVWDDAAQAKLNETPEQIQVIKVFESRLTKSREDQMKGLAEEAARLTEVWLREMQESDGWFGGASPERVDGPAEGQDASAAEKIVVPAGVAQTMRAAAARPDMR